MVCLVNDPKEPVHEGWCRAVQASNCERTTRRPQEPVGVGRSAGALSHRPQGPARMLSIASRVACAEVALDAARAHFEPGAIFAAEQN